MIVQARYDVSSELYCHHGNNEESSLMNAYNVGDETDGTDVRDVMQQRHYWIGLLQAAAANHSRQRRRRMPLARCQAVADTP